ncbi:putative protein OS=Streptomyces griseomycini OX=66895 GN=FHS37_003072 PE=4 SV=1 [Streptomyces griseomycini]|uniref:Uncharacterized protein n=1 Tax=Streptomyces griseomycini TaxID=66895 RepID=A0A7W7PQY2_9ACTN|nr:hypothetical protein [Streptomyces griseomycini]
MTDESAAPAAPRAGEGATGHGRARRSRVRHRAGVHGMPLLRRALDAVVLPEDGASFRGAGPSAPASAKPTRAFGNGSERADTAPDPASVTVRAPRRADRRTAVSAARTGPGRGRVTGAVSGRRP